MSDGAYTGSYDSGPVVVEVNDDYDQAMELWQRTPELGVSPRSNPRERIGAYLARNPGLSTVAIADGHVIGTVLCGHDGRKGSIYNVTVSPEYRRQGIARKDGRAEHPVPR